MISEGHDLPAYPGENSHLFRGSPRSCCEKNMTLQVRLTWARIFNPPVTSFVSLDNSPYLLFLNACDCFLRIITTSYWSFGTVLKFLLWCQICNRYFVIVRQIVCSSSWDKRVSKCLNFQWIFHECREGHTQSRGCQSYLQMPGGDRRP